MSRSAFCAAIGLALSLFVCHKTVFAAPIVSADAGSCFVVIALPDGAHHTVEVPPRFFTDEKQPQAGDYLVIYQPDGYVSWSPKAAFEAGYSQPSDQPSAVRAKFVAHYIQPGDGQETVHMHAVYSPDPDSPNYTWSKATPGGNLTMAVSNPAAMGQFKQGTEYLIDFTPAA